MASLSAAGASALAVPGDGAVRGNTVAVGSGALPADDEFPVPDCFAGGFSHSVLIGSEEDRAKLQALEQVLDGASQVRVYAFGGNKHRVCGISSGKSDGKQFVVPTAVESFDGRQVAQVSCGGNHTVFLEKRAGQVGGAIWACGLGAHGRLGVHRPADRTACQNMMEVSGWPAKLQRDEKVIKEIVVDDDLSVAERASAPWSVPSPVRVVFPEKDIKIAFVSCGLDHTLALSVQGGVYAWGLGSFGNLGNGTTEDCWTPHKVRIPGNCRCRMVAAGGKHSLALAHDGVIFSWGHGGNGRLGQGERCEAALLPASVARCEPAAWIAAGESHSGCVDMLGAVFMWGAASYGRIGDGVDMDAPLPRPVLTLSGSPCKRLALGTVHSLALTNKGAVFGWGSGSATGVLPPGSEVVQSVPALIGRERPLAGDWGPAMHARPVLQIAAGCFHSLALQEGGRVFAWGHSGHGRLGLRDVQRVDMAYPEILPTVKGFYAVREAKESWRTENDNDKHGGGAFDDRRKGIDLHRIACGGMHTVAHTFEGDLWTWGCNQFGQAGHGAADDVWRPSILHTRGLRLSVRSVATGYEHCLAVTQNYELVAWGRNHCGQLGFGTTSDCHHPELVHDLPDVVAVGAGEDHSAALLASGNLYTWGSAESGKLGHGSGMSSGSVQVPRYVRFNARFVAVNCGPQHTAVVDGQGSVYTFGAGWFGRLGHGDMDNQWEPKIVDQFAVSLRGSVENVDTCEIKSVQCAAYHTTVLSRDGRVWCTGRDWCVCDPEHMVYFTLFDRMREPTGGEAKIMSIASARMHTLALSEQGTLFGWGDNHNGALGLGADYATRIMEPAIISCKAWTGQRQSRIAEISTGEGHSMALFTNGELYAWGLRGGGRLGLPWEDNPQKTMWIPTKVKPTWQGAKMEMIDDGDDTAGVDLQEVEEDKDAVGGDSDGEWDLPDLQKRLRREKYDFTLEGLQKKEKKIARGYDSFIQEIFSLWNKSSNEFQACEFTLRELQHRLDRSVCRNVRRMGLFEDCPSLDIKIHPDVSQKLVYFEEILWLLQQQPCYLARLSAKLHRSDVTVLKGRPHENKDKVIEDFRLPPDVFPRWVRAIYREMEDDRTRHLCMALLRKMIELEVDKCFKDKLNFDTVFDPSHSTVVTLIKIFVKGVYFRGLHEMLFDINDPSSLISYVFSWTSDALFAMHEFELLPFEHGVNAGKAGETLEREVLEHLRSRLMDNLILFFAFIGSSAGAGDRSDGLAAFFQKVQMKRCMQCLMKIFKKAYTVMMGIKRDGSADGDLELAGGAKEEGDGERMSAKHLQALRPLVRLLLGAVLSELLVNNEQVMSTGQIASLKAACEKKLRESVVVEEDTKRGKKSSSNVFFGRKVNALMSKVHFNLVQLGKFFSNTASGNYPMCHASVKQASFTFKESYIVNFIDKQMAKYVDDTGTMMTIDLYCSHYNLKSGCVIMNTLDLLLLSNALWVFQKDVLQAKPNDSEEKDQPKVLVQERMTILLEKVQPPTSIAIKEDPNILARVDEEDKARLQLQMRLWKSELLAMVAMSSVNHNFMIMHRFLEHHTDLCFCRDCDAPIPRMVASHNQRKRSELRLLKTFQVHQGKRIDGGYPFLELQNILADPNLQTITNSDFILLKFELEELQRDVNTKMQSLPLEQRTAKDYALVSLLDRSKKVLDTMKNFNVTEAMFAEYIRVALDNRKSHHDYLLAAESGIDKIRTAQEAYKVQLSTTITAMRKSVEMSETLMIPSLVRQRASDNNMRLMFDKLDKIRKAEERSRRAQSDLTLEELAAAASATYSLHNLRAKGVIARMATGEGRLEEREYKNVKFTFSVMEGGNWLVEVIHGAEGQKQQRLCDFVITASDLECMKRAGKTSKMSYNNEFVTMNCFNLLHLVSRIGAA
eukprot:TRINITY_DN23267_c0_g2_i1.p1 TRINITY_DN23267_c0_g2~~TRINITY_DN23267_c0_g2_i1.p1  ORF type:complete len:1900 (-),score=250.90 TRINITY_DN23267_c0_g2_i1:54-5753(-)